jgi:hypothetical protein
VVTMRKIKNQLLREIFQQQVNCNNIWHQVKHTVVRNSTITLHKTMWCFLFQFCVDFSLCCDECLWYTKNTLNTHTHTHTMQCKKREIVYFLSRSYHSLSHCLISSYFVSNRNSKYYIFLQCEVVVFDVLLTNEQESEGNNHFSIIWYTSNQTHNMKYESLILIMYVVWFGVVSFSRNEKLFPLNVQQNFSLQHINEKIVESWNKNLIWKQMRDVNYYVCVFNSKTFSLWCCV